jgi:hypothetical protein
MLMMPIHPEERYLKNCPKCVPMSMLSEDWAYHNHRQTLTRLAERGGLSVVEMLANLDRIGLREAFSKYRGDINLPIAELNRRLDTHYTQSQ